MMKRPGANPGHEAFEPLKTSSVLMLDERYICMRKFVGSTLSLVKGIGDYVHSVF